MTERISVHYAGRGWALADDVTPTTARWLLARLAEADPRALPRVQFVVACRVFSRCDVLRFQFQGLLHRAEKTALLDQLLRLAAAKNEVNRHG